MTPAEALASAMIDMMGGTQADGDAAAARILAALAAAGFVVVSEEFLHRVARLVAADENARVHPMGQALAKTELLRLGAILEAARPR